MRPYLFNFAISASPVRLDPDINQARFAGLFSRHMKWQPISDCDFAGRFPPVSACHLPFSRSLRHLQNTPAERADRLQFASSSGL